jgi:hypothetical protein
MSFDDRDQHGRARFEAFLNGPRHHKAKDKPEHDDDTVLDGEEALGPPDWHVQGKSAPHGWKAVGDSFVEE